MTRLEKLQEVARDLNETMKLDPPIDADVESAKELKQAIKAEMGAEGGQLYDTDAETLKEETWEYLTETLEIEPRKAGAQAPPPAAPKKSPAKAEKKKEEKVAKKTAAKKVPAKKKSPVKEKVATAKKKEAPKAASNNKLTIKEAKAATRKLMLAGESLTRDELAKKLGGTSKQAGDALSFLKNEKFADGKPLNIVKDEDKKFHVPKNKKYLA